MENMATVYEFKIWFKNADGTLDYEFMQTRYVIANSEEEAEEKLNAWRMQSVKNGFADFVYGRAVVDIPSVIY